MEKPPLLVEVRGGDEASRQLLATSMTALLKKEGFTDVHGYVEGFGEVEPKRMMKTTVADIVEKTRPDLFRTRIEIHPITTVAPDDATLCLSAEGKGVSIVDTRGEIKEFLEQAEDYGIEKHIVVSSTSNRVVAQAVESLLHLNEHIALTAKIAEPAIPPNMVMGKF
jgi:hypothetical protein